MIERSPQSPKAKRSALNEQIAALKGEAAAVRRNYILKEACALFFEHGYSGTTLEAVALRIGVTKPFIYDYFENKAELLAEICLTGANRMFAAIDAGQSYPGSPTEKLAELIRNYTAASIEYRENIAVYFREQNYLPESSRAYVEATAKEFDEQLSALLAVGVAAGEFRVEDLRLTTLAIRGMISWIFSWYSPHGRLSDAELSARMLRIVLSLVQVDPKKFPSRT